ncbi:MAG: hypothetical protein DLM60_07115 [Pseudonocardiales bacterium]|nr:MAG: hypothetical protein DLM60_07115 [Pseudonocardiales bacterium]
MHTEQCRKAANPGAASTAGDTAGLHRLPTANHQPVPGDLVQLQGYGEPGDAGTGDERACAGRRARWSLSLDR